MLAFIALLLFAASIALVLRAVALPRARAAARIREIKTYGYSGTAQPTRVKPEHQASLSDLAGQMGSALGKRLNSFRPEALQREIMAAGLYRLSPATLLGYRVFGAVALGLLGVLFSLHAKPVGALFMIVFMTGFGWYAPFVYVRRRARFRMDSIDRALPDLIDLVVVTIQAGLGLGASLRVASTKVDGPLGDELRLLLQEQRMGRALPEALEGMLERANTPSMRSFVRSITQGESLGVSIGTIMRNLGVEMRKRRRSAVEERAQKTPVKLLFPLIFLIFPAMLILLLAPSVFNLTTALSGS